MNGTTNTCDAPKSFFDKNFVNPVGKKLDAHPILHKIVIVVAHLFRMLSMLALISFLPFGFVINCVLSLAGSLFYRIAVERNCPFRFAIPSCFGAMALAFTTPHIVALIAKTTFEQFMQALITAVPFGLYLGYIVWTTHNEVNAHRETRQLSGLDSGTDQTCMTKKSCCSG